MRIFFFADVISFLHFKSDVLQGGDPALLLLLLLVRPLYISVEGYAGVTSGAYPS